MAARIFLLFVFYSLMYYYAVTDHTKYSQGRSTIYDGSSPQSTGKVYDSTKFQGVGIGQLSLAIPPSVKK